MSEEKEMSFLDHLEELRWHVVRSLIAIFTFMIVAFVLTPWIFDNIVFAVAKPSFPTFRFLCKIGEFLHSDGFCVTAIPFKIQSRYMTGQFTMQFTASLVIGLIVAFPYVIWELWRFVRPGLYNKERRVSRGSVVAVSFLFFTGELFCFFGMSRMSVWFCSTFSISTAIRNQFYSTSYVATTDGMIMGPGWI